MDDNLNSSGKCNTREYKVGGLTVFYGLKCTLVFISPSDLTWHISLCQRGEWRWRMKTNHEHQFQKTPAFCTLSDLTQQYQVVWGKQVMHLFAVILKFYSSSLKQICSRFGWCKKKKIVKNRSLCTKSSSAEHYDNIMAKSIRYWQGGLHSQGKFWTCINV